MGEQRWHMAVRDDVLRMVQKLPDDKIEDLKRYIEELGRAEEGPRYEIVPLPYEALDALIGILDSPDLAGDALADSEAIYDEV
jgi:hypothetical protein